MNLIVFFIRASTGLFFLVMVGMSVEPTLSRSNPDPHANPAAALASLFLTTLYFWPLLVEAKNRKMVTRRPTARSFTGRRLLTFGRWSMACLVGFATVNYFFELQFDCGILSLMTVPCLMPPLDRLLFAPEREMAVRLKGSLLSLKLFPNLGAIAAVIAIGPYGQKNYSVTIDILLVSIGLLLVVPIVLFAKGGWWALSLKPILLPPPPGRPAQQRPTKVPDQIIIPMQAEDQAPTVFISYSWDDQEHEDWIVNLATKLRENGVDAILDKWDLGLLGKLLPHFMETSISRSHRVICVMTPNYKRKTEHPTGGVGYEYSIITAEIFTDNINTSKFIPLFRRGTDANAIPTALRGRKYVDMRDDTQFDEKFIHELLRDIHDEPKFRKPALGKKPKF